jgi:hypothetical protein
LSSLVHHSLLGLVWGDGSLQCQGCKLCK